MIESHAIISILLSGVGKACDWTSAAARMHAKQTERNNSESNMYFAKIFVVGH